MSASARIRARAAETVTKVLDGASLQAALPTAGKGRESNAQLQALCYGTLRAFVRLDALLDLLLTRPLKARNRVLRGLLLVGLFELDDERTPAHAVVAETVNACKVLRLDQARSLINAVLRRYLRERDQLEKQVVEEAHVRWCQPAWLHNRMVQDWPDHWQRVAEANNSSPPLWLRVNRRAGSLADYEKELLETGLAGFRRHPSASHALRLDEPVPVTALPGFAEGKVSVQDAGAQLAADLLGVAPGLSVLDACAAPGGKTAHLAEIADCAASVVALDASEQRLERVRENIARLRLENVEICHGDATQPDGWWSGNEFDRILLDAPCSATGVIRRHPDIRILRRESDIAAMAAVQLSMLESLWPLLKPGGLLLYVTCSVLREENEHVIDAFAGNRKDALLRSVPAGLPGQVAGKGWQILPGETDMDGFYYACLVKKGSD